MFTLVRRGPSRSDPGRWLTWIPVRITEVPVWGTRYWSRVEPVSAWIVGQYIVSDGDRSPDGPGMRYEKVTCADQERLHIGRTQRFSVTEGYSLRGRPCEMVRFTARCLRTRLPTAAPP